MRRQAMLLTPAGRGAVATVRAEGPDVLDAVGKLFRVASGKPLSDFPLFRIVYGRWGAVGNPGEELVVCRHGEHELEVHCHGGVAAAEQILQALAQAGFPTRDWRDWVRGMEADSISAEARLALAEACTGRAAQMLLDQYQGALRRAIQQAICACEANQLDLAAARIDDLLRFEGVGRHLTRPWRVVIAGAPNVGKSSLVNVILGFERAIVFDEPGTTRDVLTAPIALDGWPIEITDTAGLRDTADDIEAQGVARAREQLAAADLVLLVFDASQPWSGADEQLVSDLPGALAVHNKRDLIANRSATSSSGLYISAKTGAGIDALLEAVSRRLVPEPPTAGIAVPFTEAQCRVLREAKDALGRGNPVRACEPLRTL